VGLSSTWRLPIYTTHFNAWMLKNKFRVRYIAFSDSITLLKELCLLWRRGTSRLYKT
jgi:hypothetical protein